MVLLKTRYVDLVEPLHGLPRAATLASEKPPQRAQKIRHEGCPMVLVCQSWCPKCTGILLSIIGLGQQPALKVTDPAVIMVPGPMNDLGLLLLDIELQVQGSKQGQLLSPCQHKGLPSLGELSELLSGSRGQPIGPSTQLGP
eukprot:6683392-Prorocentrum_lima.AAC.1